MAALYGMLLLLGFLLMPGTEALIYNGTAESWAQYTKWNMCPNREASLYVTFNTKKDNGLLVYMDGGDTNPDDYLLVKLVNSRLSIEYQFGRQPGTSPAKYSRTAVEIEPGEDIDISIKRNRMALKLEIESSPGGIKPLSNYGPDLCFGDCDISNREAPVYTLSATNSDLYIGGVPPALKSRRFQRTLGPQFDGEIKNVEYKNCDCRRTNPLVIALGSGVEKTKCFNETSPSCVCRDCDCVYNCDSNCQSGKSKSFLVDTHV